MLVYKCDGESYSTSKKCASEAQNELPETWLLISGKIKNGLHDAHYLETNGTRHFCSRGCLERFLFKDVNPPQGNAVTHTMQDPNNVQPASEQTTEQVQAVEQEAQEQAMESAEEGSTEG